MKFYRGTSEIIDVVIDQKTILKQTLQGEDLIHANFVLESFFDFKIGDFVNWRNKRYTIYKQPSVKKDQSNKYQYDFYLESDQYKFLDAIYMFDGQADFYLLGDIEKFANLIIVNLNRVVGQDYYELGSFPGTDVKNLSFQNTNCLNVLQRICKEFNVEFSLSDDGKIINIENKIGNETGLSFEFKNGLRNIERQKVNEKNIVTKLYAFGGERNINNDYGSKKLKIEPLVKNDDLFGIIEGVVDFENIYPHREGSVENIDNDDILKFTDSTLDFDINEQLIEGVTAKVTFNTGYLAGYEFEISEYNHSEKRFTINTYEDSNGLVLPNDTLKIQVGDKYVIHDIKMPQIYIDNAEEKLKQKAQVYLDNNCLPNVIYNIVPDYPYLRRNLIQLNVGDIITVKDNDFNITYQTRILNLTQSISNPYVYSIKVGDKNTVGYITRVLSNQLEIQNSIAINRFDDTIRYNHIRRNLRNIEELKDAIFDPDGYFDTDKIKPLSIETGMLSVGTKGQQFIIRNLLIEANYEGNPNKVKCGNGTLVHFTIDPDNIKEWNLTGNIVVLDTPTSFYYVYAKCNKTGSNGIFEISTTQYQTEEPDFYYFLIGVIHSVIDDVRGISLTYGQTTINGKFITTGKIQSIDGLSYFDLDGNSFKLGNEQKGIDWNVTNPNKLTIRGGLVQSPAGDTFPIAVYRGDYSPTQTYYIGDQVSYNGSTYIFTSQTSASGNPPTDTDFWTVSALAGQSGESIYVQYSQDATNWHNPPFVSTDIYMRQKVGNGSWSDAIRIVGEQGIQGLQGVQGNQGEQGIPGQNGTNGQTTYFHIKYAPVQSPTTAQMTETPNDFIGTYVDFNISDSTNPNDYNWTRFRGEQGNQGIAGVNGANGQTSYLHIAYADDENGNGFSQNPNGKNYIGVYTDFIQTDSTDVNLYTWSRILGPQGPSGADGINGTNGVSIIWKGTFSSHPSNPQNGWAYRNSTDGKSYVYQDNTWYQMTIDGVDGANGINGNDGISIIWKGESANPPVNPQLNWVYRDTDNGLIYIYNGTAWELMVRDGNDGVDGTDGANGTNGLSVFITYHNNDVNSQPTTPTGNGTSDGWSTTPSSNSNWMSQKIADNASSGTWSDAILITGANGTNGNFIDYIFRRYPLNFVEDGFVASGFINGVYSIPNDNNPSGWFDTPPAGDDPLWMSKALKDANGDLIGVWSVPVRLSGQDGADGQNGTNGMDGVPGADGQNFYTWIKYADDENGSGLSNSPTGKEYIGFAYNKTTATESENANDYLWSKIIGEQGNQGVAGQDGANGETYYTWIKYSDNSDGTGLYDVPNDNTQYIGISVNNTEQTESNNKADYVWSRFRGEDGADGQDGTDGFAIVYRGLFDQNKVYYNNELRRDVVKYTDDIHYLYKGTNGVALAWSSSNWETFGAEFDSVATNLLLAENANIADWVIRNGKITSQNTYNGNPRAELDGQNGRMILTSPKTTYTNSGGTRTYQQNIELDSLNGRIICKHTGDSFQESGNTIIDSEGVNVDFAGIDTNDPTTATLKAGVSANVKGKMSASGFGVYNPIVAVYGRATNTDPNPTVGYGGFFHNLFANGLFIRTATSGFNYTISPEDVYVSMHNQNTATVTLPNNSNTQLNRIILIKATRATVIVSGGIQNHIFSNVNSITLSQGELGIFVNALGSQWTFNRLGL